MSGACVGWINDDSTCDGLRDGLMCVNTSVLILTVPLDIHVNVNEMNPTRS